MCGRCCHGLRLRLSIDEAIQWIDKGGVVELLCEAAPVTDDTDVGPSRTSYQAAYAFPARSGVIAFNISVILAATFSGPCPFLRPDMGCGNYAERPRVCRIYPAEVNPFQRINPAAKACPSEAWQETTPVFQREDRIVDPVVTQAIAGMREAGMRDASIKARLCALLGIDVAAFANEGLAVHAPAQDALRIALERAQSVEVPYGGKSAWYIATNRSATWEMLQGAGCAVVPADEAYIGFFPSEEHQPS